MAVRHDAGLGSISLEDGTAVDQFDRVPQIDAVPESAVIFGFSGSDFKGMGAFCRAMVKPE